MQYIIKSSYGHHRHLAAEAPPSVASYFNIDEYNMSQNLIIECFKNIPHWIIIYYIVLNIYLII